VITYEKENCPRRESANARSHRRSVLLRKADVSPGGGGRRGGGVEGGRVAVMVVVVVVVVVVGVRRGREGREGWTRRSPRFPCFT